MALRDIEYYRKRIGEVVDDYGVLDAWDTEYDENSHEFAAMEYKRHLFIERLLIEIGF